MKRTLSKQQKGSLKAFFNEILAPPFCLHLLEVAIPPIANCSNLDFNIYINFRSLSFMLQE